MRMHCKKCGRSFHQTEFHDHKCKVKPIKARNPAKIVSDDMAAYKPPKFEDNLTVLIGVRISKEAAQKLDQKRGGMTRPAKIREILEREL